MTPALDGLRSATRDIHERLHLHFAFGPLMTETPDAAGYARLLGRLYGFHAPVEAWLFQAAETLVPEIDDLPERRKAHLLLEDIAALARSFPAVASAAAPCIELGNSPSRPIVLGGLYVTEGATLGGRELGRGLEPALRPLGLVEPEGRRFFLAYGSRQGAMWRRFCAALNAAASRLSREEVLIMEMAARGMFLTLERWLTSSVATA